ncbi:MAG TPA: SMC-Scp complex subunit ScpB [Candidatus Binatia bacterium]|nr:SMC-Scp complex subunit ScpB [Candidatus Binatia bacterium]
MSDEQEQEAQEPASSEDQAAGGLWPVDRLRPVLEALLFASGDPLAAKKVAEIVEGSTVEEVKATLADLSTDLLTRGIRLVEVAGGWQLRTAPEHQRYVRKLFRERPQRLTRAATETIAIIAYKQPVTRMEIEAVRGVDSGGVIESLVERRLVKVIGRKDVPGRPLVYATTKEFLEIFGLKSLRDMPTLPELGTDFERMSEQGGFNEAESARILPLEDDDAAAADGQGTLEQSGGQGAQLEGDAEGYGRPQASREDDGRSGSEQAAREDGGQAGGEQAAREDGGQPGGEQAARADGGQADGEQAAREPEGSGQDEAVKARGDEDAAGGQEAGGQSRSGRGKSRRKLAPAADPEKDQG